MFLPNERGKREMWNKTLLAALRFQWDFRKSFLQYKVIHFTGQRSWSGSFRLGSCGWSVSLFVVMGAHSPTRPWENSIWENKWSFLICISASFYFSPVHNAAMELLSPSLVAIDHPRSHSACSARGSISQWKLYFLDMIYVASGKKAGFYYFLD